MEYKAKIMDEKAIKRSIIRISNEIIERNKGIKDIVLVGIKTRGVPLANRIGSIIEEIEGEKIPVYTVDIKFYRDDLNLIDINPKVLNDIKYDINDKIVILVDDVIYTGRTVRAALDALMDIGRPKKVQLAVLVDRGHRELPIRPDFIGKNVPTSSDEIVSVKLFEIDECDEVVIKER
ncbi:MAG: bifunctional pyr operon transcriptional regulator/uracil phosphoribosyltransferase PyrR [Tissierellales bacterium]|nr:bifunctional pyr operon transcriptional regulator/uracil phosphoribosyltransferase PyrR [Tissierellales bacterium]